MQDPTQGPVFGGVSNEDMERFQSQFSLIPEGAESSPAGQSAAQGPLPTMPEEGMPGSGEQSQAGPLASPQPPVDPRQDPRRVEHWQSRTDRLAHQLEELKPYIPIVQFIQQNPQVLQAVSGELAKQAGQGSAPTEATPPQAPERPQSYNAQEAYANPESESWKYREAHEKYLADKIVYLEQSQAARDRKLQEQFEAQRQAEEAQRFLGGVYQQVQAQYGLTSQEASEFVQVYSNPQFKLHQLVQLYRMSKGRPRNPGAVGSQEFVPPAGIGGQGVSQGTDAQNFLAGLADQSKKTKMF